MQELTERQQVLLELLNAGNEDFNSELNIYARLLGTEDMMRKAGAKDSELSGLIKFRDKLEKQLMKRYGITEVKLKELLEEGE